MDVEEDKSREEEMDEIEEDDEDEEKMEENRREEEEGRKNEENWLGRWEKLWNEKIEEKEGFEEEENNEDNWENKEELFQCLGDYKCKKLFKRNLQGNIGKNKLKKFCRLKRGVMKRCCNKCKENNGRIKRNN